MTSPREAANKAKRLYKPTIVTADEIPEDTYIEMPAWWKKATHTVGVPFRKQIVLAGDTDSGKTSACIAAVKAAQEQGITILYDETEGKTTTQDFVDWGVDPKKVNMLRETVAEEIFDQSYGWLRDRLQKNPKEKILFIVDSLGNVTSKNDLGRSMMQSDQRPGGKGKANRQGLKDIHTLAMHHDVAILIITYTYANIGSPGKTNAGGNAVNLFSSLTYQTSRKQWLERQVDGEKIRIGARVIWRLYKNHINKRSPGPKIVEMDITASGIEVSGSSDEDHE